MQSEKPSEQLIKASGCGMHRRRVSWVWKCRHSVSDSTSAVCRAEFIKWKNVLVDDIVLIDI